MANKAESKSKRGKSQSAPGLGEEAAPPFETVEKTYEWVKIGPGGRIVIPAPMRRALGVGEGDHLQLHIDGEEIRIVSKDVAIRRIQDLVAEFAPPGVSLVDRLIEDRKREAEAEDRGE